MKEKDPNHVSRKLLRLDTIIERYPALWSYSLFLYPFSIVNIP